MQYCAFRTTSLHFQTQPLEGPSILRNSPVPSSFTEVIMCQKWLSVKQTPQMHFKKHFKSSTKAVREVRTAVSVGHAV